MKLKTDVVDVAWLEKKPILYLQTSRIFNLYRKEGRKSDEKVLPTDALKYYLVNSPSYLGRTMQCIRTTVLFTIMMLRRLAQIIR